MKKKIYFLVLILNFIITNCYCTSAVTYKFSCGRFGDNLIAYLHAKWISYKYDIPLLYKEFPYSDQLELHSIEQHFYKSKMEFRNTIEFNKEMILKINKDSNTLYVIPYFPESMYEVKTNEYPYFQVDWQDKKFLKEIRQLIRPIKSLNLIFPKQNENTVNVAIHVRKNSNGFDNPLLNEQYDNQYDPNMIYVDTLFPFKFPPEIYYIEQIKKISKLFHDKQIYCFIFTDDNSPEKITERFKQAINNNNIQFDYRKTKNDHCTNILEDFFSLLQFDCMIRSDSNFSLVASKLGKYKVLIYPLHHKWIANKLFIDKVNIEIK